MKVDASKLTRSLIALMSVGTLCAAVLLKIDIQSWFIVIASTVVAFYFGHVNGKAEAQGAQAAEIATQVLAAGAMPASGVPPVGATTTSKSTTTSTTAPTPEAGP